MKRTSLPLQGDFIHRRSFLTLFGGAAAAGPMGAGAQQGERVRRIGVLTGNDENDAEAQARLQIFRMGLSELGWVEGRNLHLDVRLAGPDVVRQQSDARELVSLMPDAILVQSTTATQAVREATRTIPTVFVNVSDPVGTGIVSNLPRPEANVTGYMIYEYSLAGKWLSLLKDVASPLTRVAVLFNPKTAPYAPFNMRVAQQAGERLKLKITEAAARDSAGIEPEVAAMAGGDGGLLVLPDSFNTANRATIIALAAKHRVPAIYAGARFLATDGGLMSYGADPRQQWRDVTDYVNRILRGTKVSDLPVQFATKLELVINLKTAKALGLDVSQSLQSLADEVIE